MHLLMHFLFLTSPIVVQDQRSNVSRDVQDNWGFSTAAMKERDIFCLFFLSFFKGELEWLVSNVEWLRIMISFCFVLFLS